MSTVAATRAASVVAAIAAIAAIVWRIPGKIPLFHCVIGAFSTAVTTTAAAAAA